MPLCIIAAVVTVVVVVVYMIAWLSDILLSADNVFVMMASFHFIHLGKIVKFLWFSSSSFPLSCLFFFVVVVVILKA